MKKQTLSLAADEREKLAFQLQHTTPLGRLEAMGKMLLWLGPDHARLMHKVKDHLDQQDQGMQSEKRFDAPA
ncbi:MAG TPA: hypothetical protein VGB55_07255 [Tepidisphaeraceae bacterium]